MLLALVFASNCADTRLDGSDCSLTETVLAVHDKHSTVLVFDEVCADALADLTLDVLIYR